MIKVITSAMTGAPVLSGQVDAGIGLLYACLVTGFNSKTITIARSGQTATATCNSHGFSAAGYTVVNISGANQSEYNGDFLITNVSTNTFDFTVTGSPATPATGTITAKVAPMGFTREFTGSHKEAYRCSDLTSTRHYLCIDDSNAKYMIVYTYLSMSDIDTGSSSIGPLYWNKSENDDANARLWCMVSDGNAVYFFASWSSAYTGRYEPMAIGDIITFKAGDAYNNMLIGNTVTAPFCPGTRNGWLTVGEGSQAGQYLTRSYIQTGGTVAFAKYGNSIGGNFSQGITIPNAADNGVPFCYPLFLCEGSSAVVMRGILPGIYQPMGPVQNIYSHLNVVDNIAGLARKLLVITTGVSSSYYPCAIDITGPWR